MKIYYEHHNIKIYHGDCREVVPLLTTDVVITDPPYGVSFKYSQYNDADLISYYRLIGEALDMLQGRASIMFVFCGNRNLWAYPPATEIFCWFKPGSTCHNNLGGFREWEPILVYGKRAIVQDVIRLPDCSNHTPEAAAHPCPKPLSLIKWLIKNGCKDGETILDPFMGSGTTLRAAKDLGRPAIGVEIEERYCEIAAKRLAQEVFDW